MSDEVLDESWANYIADQQRQCERLNHLTHKPYIKLVGEGNLEYCERCCGGEVQLLEQSCDQRVLEQQLQKLTDTMQQALADCYLPCDQTIQCGCCGATYWNREESISQNWHAEGCRVFAAEVAIGRSEDVRIGPAPEFCDPWTGEGLLKEKQVAVDRHKLVTALKPFADAFDKVKTMSLANPDDVEGFQEFLDKNTITPGGVTCGDFRRAWEAFNEVNKKPEESPPCTT